MTLADLFMPPITPSQPGRRVSPLGGWPEETPKVKRNERWRRYYVNNREARVQYQRDYRARGGRS